MQESKKRFCGVLHLNFNDQQLSEDPQDRINLQSCPTKADHHVTEPPIKDSLLNRQKTQIARL